MSRSRRRSWWSRPVVVALVFACAGTGASGALAADTSGGTTTQTPSTSSQPAKPATVKGLAALGRRTLRRGMRGSDVKTLQNALRALTYKLKATGRFDSPTFKSVRAFQRKHRLASDGVVGPRTAAKIKKLLSPQSGPTAQSTPTSSPTTPTTGARFMMPLDANFTMTSKFWEARSYENHPGVDLALASGTPIHAAAAGVVTLAKSVSGYGNYTCIEHTATVTTCYAHQSRMDVQLGDRVSADQVIGLVGATGNATGPHLHFETWVGEYKGDIGHVVCSAPYEGIPSSQWCETNAPGYGQMTDKPAAASAASTATRERVPRIPSPAAAN